MKHIFYVHSHITFLVAKQYIFDQGIAADDCLFFTARNYHITKEYTSQFRNIINYPNDLFGPTEKPLSPFYNILNRTQGIKRFEKLIRKLCAEEDFIFYTFSTFSHLCCIITTMSSCKGYYIIEEGSSAYQDSNMVEALFITPKEKIIRTLMMPFFYRYYVLKDHVVSTTHKKYKGVIVTSPDAYAELEGEHIIVSNPFNTVCLEYTPTDLLSIDASLYMCNVSDDKKKMLYENLQKFILENSPKPLLAYKIHPILIQKKVDEQFRTIIQQTFTEFPIVEIENDIAIENILNTYHCNFYSDFSTAALYSHYFHNSNFSYAKWFCDKIKNKTYAASLHRCQSIIEKNFKEIHF